jgi:hypothetical protein
VLSPQHIRWIGFVAGLEPLVMPAKAGIQYSVALRKGTRARFGACWIARFRGQ